MEKAGGASLADVLDRILDKGIVINADIAVSVSGVELLGIKLRAALASFETAARYGLEFPSGVNLEAPAWSRLAEQATCPRCGKDAPRPELLASGCSWCGWVSARMLGAQQRAPVGGALVTGWEAGPAGPDGNGSKSAEAGQD